jgi:hypothetical protein
MALAVPLPAATVLSECQHPVGMITKSSLIERDIELLALGGLRGRFERLDVSQFRRPLVVPTASGKQCGNATGQLDLF